ncbi:ElyC/SanA/YdcF family protein [Nocardioides plantarum]|uniref:ElyC/SanA/YdcF family protein n=1 Tax=Nocardioides plantarum TaxID=29299 RepID=A0ABV5K5S5_9ACTN|nr:ElyC/SanA/YdcF family protein [Nocardioides plantarum]
MASPAYDEDDVGLLDTVASWLALEDPEPDHVDLMLLFGGSLPAAWDRAAASVTAGRVGTLMLVGGQGHTTDVLRRLVGGPADALEADLIARHLQREHGITDVVLERESTNCGNNVTLARDLSTTLGLHPRTVALVQDPTMQRRMDAVFRLVWPQARPVNRPGPDGRDTWPARRWTELVVGEVPRLRDDETGYGPRGRGFLAHVDVPVEVETAYAELLRRHPGWGRDAHSP